MEARCTNIINQQFWLRIYFELLYFRSECYLLNLPRCDQFATHLARNLKPLLEDLNFKSHGLRQQLKTFGAKIHRLAQESVISFPRSASTVNNSPRFTEFLRIAVEK